MLTLFYGYDGSMVMNAKRGVSLLWLWLMMVYDVEIMPAVCQGSHMWLLVYDHAGNVLRFKYVIIGFMMI